MVHFAAVRLMKLRNIREQKFFSIRDLAKATGLSKTTIVELETGRRSAHPGTVRKLAKALGVEPQELVGE